jgi:hypothetical protein
MRGRGQECVINNADMIRERNFDSSGEPIHKERRKDYGQIVSMSVNPQANSIPATPDGSSPPFKTERFHVNKLSSQVGTELNRSPRPMTNRLTPPTTLSDAVKALSPKFLTHCLLMYGRDQEWAYFLDMVALHDAVYDLYADPSRVNPEAMSLVFILAAFVVVRRGVQVNEQFRFIKDRQQISHELELLHFQWNRRTSNNLNQARSYIIRSYHYVANNRYEEGWKSLYDAIAAFKSLAVPQEQVDLRAHQTVYIAMCGLESGLCALVNRACVLEDPDFDPSGILSPVIQRRWKVQNFCRQSHKLLQTKVYNEVLFKEHDQLEKQISDYIAVLDHSEGTSTAYGQTFLIVCLLKLRTHLILLECKTSNSDDEIARDKQIRFISYYAKQLASYLDEMRNNIAHVLLGTAPHFAMYVFQGMACIWVLAPFYEQAANCVKVDSKIPALEAPLAQAKAVCQAVLERFRPDIVVCRRTCMVLQGLDMLSGVDVGMGPGSEAEPIKFNIPNPQKATPSTTINGKSYDPINDWPNNHSNPSTNGPSFITPPLSEKGGGPPNQWMMSFEPAVDDYLLWQQIGELVDFDMSIPVIEGNVYEDLFILQ